jgi:membrane-bound metal-dependent hydrolase YbcI (DUF457 family)
VCRRVREDAFPLRLLFCHRISLAALAYWATCFSLSAAVLISLALSCVWRIAVSFWRSAILYFAAYGSHLLIDLFTGTEIGWTNSGSGVPLFWPWPKNFSSQLILIPGVRHKDFAALFSLNNVWSCTYELLTCGEITAVALVLWKGRLKSRFV